MGRAVNIRSRNYAKWSKKKHESQPEVYLMTPEEVAQAAKELAEQRKLEELAAKPKRQPVPVSFDDMSAYGEWRLPPGHENWVQDRIRDMMAAPIKSQFHPPLPRVQLNQVEAEPKASPRRNGKIFKDVYPELEELARAYREPPECEGAVGYDQRYYASPYLVRVTCRPKPLPQLEGTSFLDARRCAQLVAEDQKAQEAKARRKAKKRKPVLVVRRCKWSPKLLRKLNKKSKPEPKQESDPEVKQESGPELYQESDPELHQESDPELEQQSEPEFDEESELKLEPGLMPEFVPEFEPELDLDFDLELSEFDESLMEQASGYSSDR